MNKATQELYPLANATPQDLANICDALWGWSPCSQWVQGGFCFLVSAGCPCLRANKLEPFFNFYRNVTAYYLPDDMGRSKPALRSHGDLRDIVVLLRKNMDEPRMRLTARYFATRAAEESQMPLLSDQNRAFNLAARVVTMVLPSAENQSDGLLETGTQPPVWPGEISLASFISSVFPKQEFPSLTGGNDVVDTAKTHVHSIMAKRLKKIAKLKMVPTDNLSSHLFLDTKNGTLAVFHYTSVLKENLAYEGEGSHQGGPTTRLRSSIPAPLALETLATIKDVLFPDDEVSQSMLRTLVSRAKFDPDIARIVDSPPSQPGTNEPMIYQYWGSRLLDLYDELENPTPRGYFQKWLERKSGARHAMMATLIGLFVAVMLGALTLVVSVFQAWVAWQQWRHPKV
ncbi:hypothetical protein QQZ08_002727 [Neonectria magnoliae]|uniref:Uncharacterized protein n=1 Tax=Neonectria magnoliae TaxID=2732573 RepID=A0ABR1ICX6_9HYPO